MNDSIKEMLKSIENNSMKHALEAMKSALPSLDHVRLPEIRLPEPYIPKIPSRKEIHEYQSAEVLMQRLADSIGQWRQKLPSDQQPAILAILNGGIQITVERLSVESFHGIRIEGKIGGNPCMVLGHQATTQLLCYIEKVENENQRKKNGFTIGGKEQQI